MYRDTAITAGCHYQALIDEVFEQVDQPERYHVLHQAGQQVDLVLEALPGDLDDLLLAVDAVLGDRDFRVRRVFEDAPERDRLQERHGQHDQQRVLGGQDHGEPGVRHGADHPGAARARRPCRDHLPAGELMEISDKGRTPEAVERLNGIKAKAECGETEIQIKRESLSFAFQIVSRSLISGSLVI